MSRGRDRSSWRRSAPTPREQSPRREPGAGNEHGLAMANRRGRAGAPLSRVLAAVGPASLQSLRVLPRATCGSRRHAIYARGRSTGAPSRRYDAERLATIGSCRRAGHVASAGRERRHHAKAAGHPGGRRHRAASRRPDLHGGGAHGRGRRRTSSAAGPQPHTRRRASGRRRGPRRRGVSFAGNDPARGAPPLCANQLRRPPRCWRTAVPSSQPPGAGDDQRYARASKRHRTCRAGHCPPLIEGDRARSPLPRPSDRTTAMNSDRLVAGLDIGSAKTTAIIAEVVGDLPKHPTIKVLGVGQARTTGMRRGIVSDIEETTRSIRKALQDAERMPGAEVTDVYCGIAAEHVRAMTSKGIVAVSNDEIGKGDVDRANEVARAQANPPHRELRHAIPHAYSVGRHAGIRDPIGMSGTRLETEMYLVTIGSSPAVNRRTSVKPASYQTRQLVPAPPANALAGFTAEGKELCGRLVARRARPNDLPPLPCGT